MGETDIWILSSIIGITFGLFIGTGLVILLITSLMLKFNVKAVSADKKYGDNTTKDMLVYDEDKSKAFFPKAMIGEDGTRREIYSDLDKRNLEFFERSVK